MTPTALKSQPGPKTPEHDRLRSDGQHGEQVTGDAVDKALAHALLALTVSRGGEQEEEEQEADEKAGGGGHGQDCAQAVGFPEGIQLLPDLVPLGDVTQDIAAHAQRVFLYPGVSLLRAVELVDFSRPVFMHEIDCLDSRLHFMLLLGVRRHRRREGGDGRGRGRCRHTLLIPGSPQPCFLRFLVQLLDPAVRIDAALLLPGAVFRRDGDELVPERLLVLVIGIQLRALRAADHAAEVGWDGAALVAAVSPGGRRREAHVLADAVQHLTRRGLVAAGVGAAFGQIQAGRAGTDKAQRRRAQQDHGDQLRRKALFECFHSNHLSLQPSPSGEGAPVLTLGRMRGVRFHERSFRSVFEFRSTPPSFGHLPFQGRHITRRTYTPGPRPP